MGEQGLTNNFNTNTNPFGGLFSIFTTGGNSLFEGLGNFLKFLFSSFASTSPETPVTRNPETKQQTSKRGFLGTLKDDFSAATDRVVNFFRPAAFDTASTTSRTEYPVPYPQLRVRAAGPARMRSIALTWARARSVTWM